MKCETSRSKAFQSFACTSCFTARQNLLVESSDALYTTENQVLVMSMNFHRPDAFALFHQDPSDVQAYLAPLLRFTSENILQIYSTLNQNF